jgi:hypothetical protein
MTKEQIESVLDRVRSWPRELQEEVVELLLAMEAEQGQVYRVTVEERAELQEALAEIDRGEVATDAEIAAAFRRSR